MTTGGFKPDLNSRIAGFLLSGVIHLAAGFALFYANTPGGLVRGPNGGDLGDTLVVELIPLDRTAGARGAHAIDQSGNGNAPRATAAPAISSLKPRAVGLPRERLAPGTATSDQSASTEEHGDDRQMSDLPSSEVAAYLQRLESHLARYRVFPAAARSAGSEGVVTVYFSVTREGSVLDAWVETSSGVSALDAEALAAILRAQPLPGLPQSWPGRINVSLPISFRLG